MRCNHDFAFGLRFSNAPYSQLCVVAHLFKLKVGEERVFFVTLFRENPSISCD